MPVTARLSKRFYDQFGDETAAELVEWFNQVDATLHNQLRELNDANFARFEAKLEQRIAEVKAGTAELTATMERRFGDMERRFGEQARWFLATWITIIGAAVALWFRR